MNLTEFHSKYPDSVQWRITPSGLEVKGAGLVVPTAEQMRRAVRYVEKYRELYAAASAEFGVPVELLIACSLTESMDPNPETCVREEPGYTSDEATPHRISAGFCQLLISTARSTMKDPKIDRKWLMSVANSLRACASYIKDRARHCGTAFDPILTACAYNAGGLYRNDGAKNRWKLRQFPIGTSKHADRFAAYFTAAMQLTESVALGDLACVRFKTLLSTAESTDSYTNNTQRASLPKIEQG